MSKFRAGALAVAAVFALSALAGCKSVEQDVSTLAHTYTPNGFAERLMSELESVESSSESSSEESSSEESDSSTPEPVVIPPAPVQTIQENVNVMDDPAFQPTAEDEAEDPQKPSGNGGGSSDEGIVVIPPEETPSDSSSSESSSDSSSSDPPSSDSSSSESGSSDSSSSDSSGDSSSDSSTEQPPQNGWYTNPSDGKKYYYVNGKTKPEGWHFIDDIGYYFDANGAVGSKAGIDVSKYQGDIDWAAVKADGIEFAMIRVGYRGYGTDPGSGQVKADVEFTDNIRGAQANGIEVGVYFYTQATSEREVLEEVDFVLNALEPYNNVKFVAFDTEKSSAGPNEVGRGDEISASLRTDLAIIFCERIKAAGYTPLIYSDSSWFKTHLELNRLTGYQKWLAYWPRNGVDIQFKWDQGEITMWQFCSDGKVAGINGRVDRNAWKIV